MPVQVARDTDRRKATSPRIGTHKLARQVKNPDRAGDVEASPHTWRMFPRHVKAPRRSPTLSSRRPRFWKRRGLKAAQAIRARTVRRPKRVRLETSPSPGQAEAACCQFLAREKNAPQQRQATISMAAANDSEWRPRALPAVTAPFASPTVA